MYHYMVGSVGGGWSPILSFRSMPGLSVPMRYAVYADFGYRASKFYRRIDVVIRADNHQSLEGLINETAAGHFDMALHLGDIGYDMEDNSSRTGGTASSILAKKSHSLVDLFLNMMQPVASAIPYQTCPGNHEHDVRSVVLVCLLVDIGRRSLVLMRPSSAKI